MLRRRHSTKRLKLFAFLIAAVTLISIFGAYDYADQRDSNGGIDGQFRSPARLDLGPYGHVFVAG